MHGHTIDRTGASSKSLPPDELLLLWLIGSMMSVLRVVAGSHHARSPDYHCHQIQEQNETCGLAPRSAFDTEIN